MADVKITVALNGPYLVEGPIELVDPDGNHFTVQEGQRIAICRCGRSDSKPFCNGNHRNQEPFFDAPTKAV